MMIEKTRSINLVANLILISGMIYILFPLAVAFLTSTQSHEDVIRQGISYRIGSHF